jgi:hypothetical protein
VVLKQIVMLGSINIPVFSRKPISFLYRRHASRYLPRADVVPHGQTVSCTKCLMLRTAGTVGVPGICRVPMYARCFGPIPSQRHCAFVSFD